MRYEKIAKNSFGCIWKNPNAAPKLCFVGCPHLSLEQLKTWTVNIENELKKNGKKQVTANTVFTASPDVLEAFSKTEYAARLKATGVITSYMLFANHIDSLVAAGAVLADVWVDGVTVPVIDGLGDEFLGYVKDGMMSTVRADGIVEE